MPPALPGYGSDWKKEVKSRYVAQARVWNAGGEMLARKDNFVELDPEVKDAWGIPVLKIHFTHGDNDYKLLENFQQNAEELFRKAGGEVMPAAPVAPAGFPGGPGAPTGAGATTAAAGRGGSGRAQAGGEGGRTVSGGRPRREGGSPSPARRIDPRSRHGEDEREAQATACSTPSARPTTSPTCMCSAGTRSRQPATSIRR